MAGFKSFEEIDAWTSARVLTREIYEISKAGDFARDYGLRDQLRRASASIMANIAEGFERNGNREFLQFLSLAKGSAGETRSLLYVALDAGYLTQPRFEALQARVTSIGAMIQGLIDYLKESSYTGPKYKV